MPDAFNIDTLLEQMVAHNASDLHVTVGSHTCTGWRPSPC